MLQLEEKWWTFALTGSENWRITALASKVSWFSMLLVVELAQGLVHCFWSAYRSTMAGNPSSVSPSILHHRYYYSLSIYLLFILALS